MNARGSSIARTLCQYLCSDFQPYECQHVRHSNGGVLRLNPTLVCNQFFIKERAELNHRRSRRLPLLSSRHKTWIFLLVPRRGSYKQSFHCSARHHRRQHVIFSEPKYRCESSLVSLNLPVITVPFMASSAGIWAETLIIWSTFKSLWAGSNCLLKSLLHQRLALVRG